MILQKIIYRPEARLLFSKAEVAVLMKCSQHHYDGKCKQLSQPGGEIFGLNNRIDEPAEATMDSYVINLLVKTTERAPLCCWEAAHILNAKLSRVLADLNAVNVAANEGKTA